MVETVAQLIKKRSKKKALLDDQLDLLKTLLELNERQSKVQSQANKVEELSAAVNTITASIVSVGNEDQKKEALEFSDRANEVVKELMDQVKQPTEDGSISVNSANSIQSPSKTVVNLDSSTSKPGPSRTETNAARSELNAESTVKSSSRSKKSSASSKALAKVKLSREMQMRQLREEAEAEEAIIAARQRADERARKSAEEARRKAEEAERAARLEAEEADRAARLEAEEAERLLEAELAKAERDRRLKAQVREIELNAKHQAIELGEDLDESEEDEEEPREGVDLGREEASEERVQVWMEKNATMSLHTQSEVVPCVAKTPKRQPRGNMALETAGTVKVEEVLQPRLIPETRETRPAATMDVPRAPMRPDLGPREVSHGPRDFEYGPREVDHGPFRAPEKYLPKWKLENFDGNPLEWPEWSGLFKNTVLQSNISRDEKMMHLRTLLTGKAKTAVAGFAFNGSMLDEAWRVLEKKFGKPHVIVSAQMEKLINYPYIKMHNSEDLVNYSIVVSSLTNVLKSMGYANDLGSSSNVDTAVSKLPPNIREKWCEHLAYSGEDRPTLETFDFWLQYLAESHEKLMRTVKPSPRTDDKFGRKTQKVKGSTNFGNANKDSKDFKCVVCTGVHKIWNCADFKAKTPNDRVKIVKDQQLCFACLNPGHTARGCTKKRKCSENGCNSYHNVLIHGADRSAESNPPRTEEQVPRSSAMVSRTVSPKIRSNGGLLQLIKLDVIAGFRCASTYALLDTASTHSWISEDLREKLSVNGKPELMSINSFSGVNDLETERCTVQISSRSVKQPATVEVWVKRDFCLGSGIQDLNNLKSKYPHLSPLPDVKIDLRDVKLLLGQNAFKWIRPLNYSYVNEDEPWAVRTPLGWVVSGPLPDFLRETSQSSDAFLVAAEELQQQDHDLSAQVRKWWDTESYATKSNVDPRSTADKDALKKLEDETVHDGTRYVVPMLWAKDPPDLPNNFNVARSNFASLEKRFARDEELKERYSETIKSDLRNNFVRKVPKEELERTKNQLQWYLPHHPVLNPNKPGKVRRVCNAASKYKGTSLNDALSTGPDLLNNLVGILLRFRLAPVALAADVEAMFMQVGVPAKDQPTLRFLWREDPSGEIEVFEYIRHIFGARCSPTCAIFAMNKTAEDNSLNLDLEVVTTVQNEFYMDDFLKSLVNAPIAIALAKEVTALLATGGFKLAKWVSNNAEVLITLRDEGFDLAKDVTETHVLGIKWLIQEDSLVISRGTAKEFTDRVSQREVLAEVSSVFDPLGFIAPFTIRARLLLKRIWKLNGQNWDNLVQGEELTEFKKWSKELPLVLDFKVQRQYFTDLAVHLELHVFSDASAVAMCAVVYLRAVYLDGTIKVAFVIGKSRVAPMKHQSIPKLELQAALIATTLYSTVKEELRTEVQSVTFWCDSSTVLQWIKTSLLKQQVYVANRVTDILECTTVDQWRFITGEVNPADCGTRGMSPVELRESAWVNGPAFLSLPTEKWPVFEYGPKKNEHGASEESHGSMEDDPGPCAVTALAKSQSVPQLISWERFSSFNRLVNCVAYCLRVTTFAKKPRTYDEPTVEERRLAKEFIWKRVQLEVYSSELKALKTDNPTVNSPIGPLSPFIGPDGLIRARGRLRKATEIPYDTKFPIILPGSHPAVRLYLEQVHTVHHHQGVEYLKSIVQQEFWVTRLRNALRLIKRNCLHCKKRSASTLQPPMADLPVERLNNRAFAFTDVGVDYFGPFEVKFARKSLKRWSCLFTCMVTRACHIEICHSLDADSCIMALKRFIFRRGKPKSIRSDNGTNFVGAAKEMKQCLENWNSALVEKSMVQLDIKWTFNPPSAPHFGGIWERIVQSCKRAMYDILGPRRMTDETLMTTMCLVEQTLNARPLVQASSDVDDLEALTPNHFILGRPSVCLPSCWTSPGDVNLRKAYRHAEIYADMVWKRWLREYLPTLNARGKWTRPVKQQLRIGDLVWLVEPSQPRSTYILGRIEELYRGDDDMVRTVRLRTATGSYTRPVVKILPLDVDSRSVSAAAETGPAMSRSEP